MFPYNAKDDEKLIVEIEEMPEPEIDDSVYLCPNCERPQQFSGPCMTCSSDPDYQDYLNRSESNA